MEEKTLHQKLVEIQQRLKVPKNQINKFGGYNYRSCEDIFEAVKPLLGDLVLRVSDEVIIIGAMTNTWRFYVKATATLTDGKDTITNVAYARETDTKKGMDEAQITGATSSYARKYALNGLFLLDDVKDADATNKHEEEEKPVHSAPSSPKITDRERSKIALEKIAILFEEQGLNKDATAKLKTVLSKKVFGTASGTEINKLGFPVLERGLRRFEAIFKCGDNTVEKMLAGQVVEPEGEDVGLFEDAA